MSEEDIDYDNEEMEEDTQNGQRDKHDELRRKKRRVNKKQPLNQEDLFLCCNLVEESYVGKLKLPVLRYLKRNISGFINGSIDHVIWLKVTQPIINEVRIYICDKNGHIISLPKNKLNCTLLLIPWKY